MKVITRETDYALRALKLIAVAEEKISITGLCESLDISKPFLRKILQILAQKNVLKSSKGKGGGFELLLNPKDITLYSLMIIFQGKQSADQCLMGEHLCKNRNSCVLKKKVNAIEEQIAEQFRGIRLSDLITEGENSGTVFK